MSAAKNLGLLRLMTAVAYAYDTSEKCTDHAREQMQMLTNRTSLLATYLTEMGHIQSNFERALGTGFAQDFPLLLFVVAENKQTPEWLELHHRPEPRLGKIAL